ncbi:DsbE family thiol:disulfide interchange protein [Methylocella tundrae]|uniref:Thiol:disulfide interchange protein CycY n=1 Tax=Methylocella tundrae TaxID=227605 RepID=A0A4V6IMJ4_METTU|nr:DsbE family thiol:disulfide interchange protein [Methylocella tundrae]WPP06090.1 DsbE family thiol:disulfide interchange protein [Methylocella tundrae]VFU08694.1 Thiol:disulfide interchange protein CycY [Methylocella tundrae]
MTTTEPQLQPAAPVPAKRRSLLVFLPLLFFGAIAALFLLRLFAGDASRLPSALIGREVPAFTLAGVEGLPGANGLSDADLRQGHVTIVNVFASWCVPCREEHPTLMGIAGDHKLKDLGVRLVGLAYKDTPANVRELLGADGDPYATIGADPNGRAAIDLGVYGVPETFIIRGDGTVAYRFVGPLSDESYAATLLPEIKKAAGANS